MSDVVDARGVVIEPGDTVIYGFGVGRSVAMAEAVVVGEPVIVGGAPVDTKVSLTPTGLVRIRIVRRSYSSGEKPRVAVAPDRLVVLKGEPGLPAMLPPSPYLTQDEDVRHKIEQAMESYTRGLRATEVPDWCRGEWQLATYHGWCADQLGKLRRKLRALDD